MPVVGRGNDADDLAIAHQRLVVKQHRLGVGQTELHQPPVQPFITLAQHRVTPDESALLRADGKAQARLQHMILIGDVMPEMAERLLDPARIERVQTAEPHPHICRLQRLEHMRGLIGGDVKLPPQLAHIGHAMRPRDAHTDLDFPRSAKGMRGVAKVIRADRRHQIARFRPHHAQHRLRRCHIGNHDELIRQVLAQPRQIPLQRRPRHHEEIRGLRQPRHGQIALNPTARVQHLRVDNPSRRNVHVIGAHPLEERASVAPLDADLAE
ncbi:hypothetical protein GALL_487370 [mine drainage metagenome]|uniref:Uncharacterized protein n=1 Tax=mine drainage metagenome TaxID=410659 RepID=A0A1J5PWH2_9ZZZZ